MDSVKKMILGSAIAVLLASTTACTQAASLAIGPSVSMPREGTEQSAPILRTVSPPGNALFPGVIRLEVDATDVARRIYRLHESIPVNGGGPVTLLYPQWTAGDHAPNGPLDKLAGLQITAAGQRLRWVRDTVKVYAFHVNVPSGVRSIELDYEFLGATESRVGAVLMTRKMIDLQWSTVILYPAGFYAKNITFQPTVTIPVGWAFASALESPRRTGDVLAFAPSSLDALVDSPLMAGRYVKRINLVESPVPIWLDIAGDDLSDLEITPKSIEGYRNVVTQTYKLFHSHHFDHYDFMFWLSEDFGPVYYEHHRSSENGGPPGFFKPENDSPLYRGNLLHGFVHSWNGMFRRPADMSTPNFNVPERDSLLWVFEGLTNYWQQVLTARSGLWTQQDALNTFTSIASKISLEAGTDWRPLADVSNEPLIGGRRPQSWPSWQRNLLDSYRQGELIWLDVDTLLRKRTGGKRSLDDFAQLFFGFNDGSYETDPYTLDDIVISLNHVMPYDWSTFFSSRLDAFGPAPLNGLTQGGYKLVYTAIPTAYAKALESATGNVDLSASLGIVVGMKGRVAEVLWDGPAFKAGMMPGGTITSINASAFSIEKLQSVIQEAEGGAPIKLAVKDDTSSEDFTIVWKGGMRYPHLETMSSGSPLLNDILQPR